VDKKGDGWIRREMGGKEGRWVDKKGDGWIRREMGGMAKQGDGWLSLGDVWLSW
jgi:hypothetical protein